VRGHRGPGPAAFSFLSFFAAGSSASLLTDSSAAFVFLPFPGVPALVASFSQGLTLVPISAQLELTLSPVRST